jgi:hypothetical protein
LAMWQTMLGSLSSKQCGHIASKDYRQMLQFTATESLTQLATAFHLITEKIGLDASMELLLLFI